MDDGDAIAFSVEKQRPLYGEATGRGRNYTGVATCLVRVDRRRTDRKTWERVMEETTKLETLNFMTQLERHRFEYRVSVTRCDDMSWLALPSHIRVPRHYGKSHSGEDVHIGVFRLVKMRPRSVDAVKHNGDAWLLVMSFLMSVLCGLWALYWTRSCRSRTSKSKTAVKQRMERTETLDEGQRFQHHVEELVEESFLSDTEAPIGKEILTSELPEVNDDDAWRDFFDAHIYGRKNAMHDGNVRLDSPCTHPHLQHPHTNDATLPPVPSTSNVTHTSLEGRREDEPTTSDHDFQEFWQM